MQKFIVPMILAAFVLAGCGAKSGGTPITPSDSDTEATSVPSGSSTEATSSVDTSDFYVIPTLHLVFYEKFVNEDAAKGFIGGFNEYLTTKEVTVTTITYDLIGPNSDAGPFTDEVQAFEEAENHPYVFDAILGAKGNLTTYITDRFEVLKNDGSNVEFALGTKPDRRLYTRKNTENEAVPYLINHVRILAGLPEEEETSEDTSSEDISEDTSADVSEDTSEEISSEGTSEETSGETSGEISEEVSGETSGETSEESKVVDLHVVYYEQYASASVQSDFETKFEGYLTANNFTKGDITYKSLNSADVATFTSDLETFQGTVEYQVDVLLGVKAKLGEYITTNYSVYKVDGANFEYPLGDSTDRRLWVRNDTANTVGVEALVAYFTSIK